MFKFVATHSTSKKKNRQGTYFQSKTELKVCNRVSMATIEVACSVHFRIPPNG